MQKKLYIKTGFFVIPQQLKIHKKLNYSIVGKMPEYIKIVNPRSFFKKLDIVKIIQESKYLTRLSPKYEKYIDNKFKKLICKLAINFYKCIALLSSMPNDLRDCSFVDEFDQRVDDLWSNNKVYLKYAQVRNSTYMNWYFDAKKGWEKIVHKKNGKINGYSIISIKTLSDAGYLSNLKILSIIDIFWNFKKSKVLNTMLSFIEKYSIKNKVDVIVFSINKRNVKKPIFKKGFIRIPGRQYFVIHSLDKENKISGKMKDWFITRGDADAAGNLGP